MNEQQKAESKITFIFYCVVIIVLGGLTLGFASGFLSFPTDSQVNLERTLTEGDLQLINEINSFNLFNSFNVFNCIGSKLEGSVKCNIA